MLPLAALAAAAVAPAAAAVAPAALAAAAASQLLRRLGHAEAW